MNQELEQELRGITAVLNGEAERSGYAVDGEIPPLVAVPSTETEVAACLAAAARHGAAVALRGAGTKGDLGNLPHRLDLVVSLERLNQVVEYVPADLTITVQAGMRFADLQALVAQHGQTVPIDPPRAATATIGGIVATGSTGPRRMAYGSMRDMVLGTRLALADGRVVKTGGRVVKNVAGYDMNKLLVGSLGTLGAMTEVTLKLRPLPPVSRTIRIGFADLAACLRYAEEILNSELLPAALAVLSPGAARRLDAPGPVTLAVALEETAPNVTYQEERVTAMAAAGRTALDSLSGAEAQAFWASVRDYGDQFGASLRSKVNTVISDLGNQLRFALQPPPGMAVDGIAYAGSGTVLIFGFDQGAGANGLAAAANAWFTSAASAGGSAVLESAPIEIKRLIDVWGPRRPEWKLMEGIKRSFDPGRVLNPGRYAGGL